MNREAHLCGRLRQTLIPTHERPPAWPFVTPHKRGGQLPGITGAQGRRLDGRPKSGEMIDEATIKIALMDLAKGAQAGMVDQAELKDWSQKSKAITGYDILELMRRVA